MTGGQRIVFGQNANQTYHAFRYTDILGLDRDAVMEAVCADLQPLLPLPFPPPGNMPTTGIARVSGIELKYNAYPLSEELVNVGSIVGPETRPVTRPAR